MLINLQHMFKQFIYVPIKSIEFEYCFIEWTNIIYETDYH